MACQLSGFLCRRQCVTSIKNDSQYDIPISYYPDMQSFYTDIEKSNDLGLALTQRDLIKYAIALDIIKNYNSLCFSRYVVKIKVLLEVYHLLMTVNELVAKTYLDHLMTHEIYQLYNSFLTARETPKNAPIFAWLEPLHLPSYETNLLLEEDLLSKIEFILHLIDKKGDVQSCINNFEDYYCFLSVCVSNLRKTFIAMGCIKPLILNIDNFRAVFNLLDSDGKIIFIDFYKETVLKKALSSLDVQCLLQNLSDADEEKIYTALKNNIIKFSIQSCENFYIMSRFLNGQFLNFLSELKVISENSGLTLSEDYIALLSDKKISNKNKQIFLDVFLNHIKTNLINFKTFMAIAKNVDETTFSFFSKIIANKISVIILNTDSKTLSEEMGNLFYLESELFSIVSKLVLKNFPWSQISYEAVFAMLKKIMGQNTHYFTLDFNAIAALERNNYIMRLVERLAYLTTNAEDFLKFSFFKNLLSEKKSRDVFFKITLPKLNQMFFTVEQFMRVMNSYFIPYPESRFFDVMVDRLIHVIANLSVEVNWCNFARHLSMDQSKVVLKKIKEAPSINKNCFAVHDLFFHIIKNRVLEKIDHYLVENTITKPIEKKHCVQKFKEILMNCQTILEIKMKLDHVKKMSADIVLQHNKNCTYFFKVNDDSGALFSECLQFIEKNILLNEVFDHNASELTRIL